VGIGFSIIVPRMILIQRENYDRFYRIKDVGWNHTDYLCHLSGQDISLWRINLAEKTVIGPTLFLAHK
jgi:hypothetical protein